MTRTPIWLRWALGLAALVVALYVALALFDWNMLRGFVGREASAASGRRIEIHGNLKVHLLSWTPGLTADDVVVGGTPGVAAGDLAHIGRFAVKIKLLPLLIGRVELPLVDFEQPQIWAFRNAAGLSNWRSTANASKPTKLPLIQHFMINNGQLKLVDQKRKMVLNANLQSSETNAPGGKGVFQLQGQGLLNKGKFSLNLTSGALIALKTDQPYHYDADIRSGETHIVSHGALDRPFDFGHLTTALTVSGPDLADLYYLIGVALPNTSPYRLQGDLVRDNQKYTFTHVSGQVGRSDLEGQFQLDHSGARPDVTADLRSRSLDMPDLAAAIGAPSKRAERSPLQAAQAAKQDAEHRLLPDATLDLTRIRSTDASVRYQADSVIARPGLPLRKVHLNLTLDHGVMTIDPLGFGFPQGELTGKIRIDARQDTPQDAVDLKVTNVRLEDFVGKTSASPPLVGTVEARAKLTGQGDSVHEVASTANGDITFVAPHGEIRQSFAELLGIDVSRGLGLLLAKDKSSMGVRCAVANFHADHGVLTARNLLFDSDTVVANGEGTINLGDESIDLTLKGHPKDFRLVHLKAPITVGGYLSAPKIGVQPAGAAAQAGAAVALSAVFTPLAAILPFVDAGLAKDADCVGAVKDAQSLGAPVKVSSTTPTNAKAVPDKARRR